MKQNLLSIALTIIAVLNVSCSKDTNPKKLAGIWRPVAERYFINDKEVDLEYGETIFLYHDNENIMSYFERYTKVSEFESLVYISFEADGSMSFCGFSGTYKIADDKVVCTVFGGQEVLTIEGDYLIEETQHNITGYVIGEGFWPNEDVRETRLDGVSRVFKVKTYYSK